MTASLTNMTIIQTKEVKDKITTCKLKKCEYDDECHIRLFQIHDQIQVMIRQEKNAVYQCYDYLAANESELEYTEDSIDEECHFQMCQWCYQVANLSHYRRETVSHAISYLNRYLCTTQGKPAMFNTTAFQLSAMTSLYIAIKNQEYLDMSTNTLAEKFASLSRGMFCVHDFIECETQILTALQWRLNGPTPHSFIECYLSLIAKEYHEEIVKYDIRNIANQFADDAICDYSCSITSLSSEIGLAVLLNALGSTIEAQDSFLSIEIKNALIFEIQEVEKYASSISALPFDNDDEMSSTFCQLSLQNDSKSEMNQTTSVKYSRKEKKTNSSGSPVSIDKKLISAQ